MNHLLFQVLILPPCLVSHPFFSALVKVPLPPPAEYTPASTPSFHNMNDAFLGDQQQRTTRPSSPMAAASLSVPASPPPDFYLVTSSEPAIEQSLYQGGFQPDLLFPNDFGLYQQMQQQQYPLPLSMPANSNLSPWTPAGSRVGGPVTMDWDSHSPMATNSSPSTGTGSGIAPQSFSLEEWMGWAGLA